MNEKCLYQLVLGYEPPTPKDFNLFKTQVGKTTQYLGDMVGIKSKHLRGVFSEREFVKGNYIEYWNWRYWIETFGLSEPATFTRRPSFDVNELVFERGDNWKAPLVSEFLRIIELTGRRPRFVSQHFGVPEGYESVLKKSLHLKGDHPIELSKESWFSFLDVCGFSHAKDFEKAPVRQEHLSTLKSGNYVPPKPTEFRRFVAWSGMTLTDIHNVTGLSESGIVFYQSNRSSVSGYLKPTKSAYNEDESVWRRPSLMDLRLLKVLYGVDERTMDLLSLENSVKKKLSNHRFQFLLNVDYEQWFAFLASVGVGSLEQLLKDLERYKEEKGKVNLEYRSESPIPYAAWRLLLGAFSLTEPESVN